MHCGRGGDAAWGRVALWFKRALAHARACRSGTRAAQRSELHNMGGRGYLAFSAESLPVSASSLCDSGNYVALHSLELGQSWNFFAYNQSNHISEPKGVLTGAAKVLGKKFNQASQCAPQVDLSDMVRFGQDGQEARVLKTPFKVFLIPSEEVQLPAKEKTVDRDEANAEVEAFPVGTVLYTAYACGKAAGTEVELMPTDGGLEKACADPILLGQMVTTTKCTMHMPPAPVAMWQVPDPAPADRVPHPIRCRQGLWLARQGVR